MRFARSAGRGNEPLTHSCNQYSRQPAVHAAGPEQRLAARRLGEGTMQTATHTVSSATVPMRPSGQSQREASRWLAALRVALAAVAIVVVSCLAVALSLS